MPGAHLTRHGGGMSDAAHPAPAPATGATTAATGATTAAAAPAHRPARHARTDSALTTRRWAVGVLAVATTALAGLVALLVATSWFLAEAWTGSAKNPVADLLAITRDVAPALLVGWCTGLAASAVLSRGEGLGPRLAGVAAGALGTASGAAVLALTGSLL
jgi:hypothetical protein